MLTEAEKFASSDQAKRKIIDLKNQAETLCFEAERELGLFKDNISEENKIKINTLIEKIKIASQQENIKDLEETFNELKVAMKGIVEAPKPLVQDDTNFDATPFLDLNDL